MSELSKRFFSRNQPHQYSDVETGCQTTNEAAFQACRQAYFLKQQNQLVQQQASSTAEMQSQTEQLQQELSVLKTNPPTPAGIVLTGKSSAAFAVIFILAIVTTVFVTKRALRK